MKENGTQKRGTERHTIDECMELCGSNHVCLAECMGHIYPHSTDDDHDIHDHLDAEP